MSDFRLIAINPAVNPDAGIAIAASRTAATGVLDLTSSATPETCERLLADLDRYGRAGCGVRISSVLSEVPWWLLEALPEKVRTVILESDSSEVVERCLRLCAERDRELLVEASTLDRALEAQRAGAAGVIAKGHEAGGRIADDTALILLQRLASGLEIPFYLQGGISPHTAAAAAVGGAAGVVLDWQLALTRESALARPLRDLIARLDGSETACLGSDLGEMVRVLSLPGSSSLGEARARETELLGADEPAAERLAAWRTYLTERSRRGGAEDGLVFLGQEACMAEPLARRYVTVGGILQAYAEAVTTNRREAARLRPLAADSRLAVLQGTRYPIAQGPMTRVSDKSAFALSVAEAGGLPFLALSVLREAQVRELLQETAHLLGDYPWGVGILGFVPLELRQEQLQVIRELRPKHALIAGGRPDQALALEAEGISTYLHVPSPGLLEQFLTQGSRKFVFEGRECGGHVGPRTSFVLWSSMIDLLLTRLGDAELADCQVLFAGGIHDARSAAIVSTLAAPLAARGVGVGVLMGTAYLFTREAVETGAIVPGFQEAAVACDRTVLLESAPGHATRSTVSAFSDHFLERRRELLRAGMTGDEIQKTLEELNLGRLRIASKGIERVEAETDGSGEPGYFEVDAAGQRARGLYMIGQVATLRHEICSIEELHREVSTGGADRLQPGAAAAAVATRADAIGRPSDVAIVGMSCLLPMAQSIRSYWSNILAKQDAVIEVPKDRWDWHDYFDADRKTRDKVYSKWGGFLDDIVFDPVRYGMPPNSLSSIEPLQLLMLEVARAAMADAGYLDRPFDRERASVILGAGGGVSDLGVAYSFRSSLPLMTGDLPADLEANLPEWTEDSFPGILMNVAAGRVANRLDLGGVNCTMDAACAASLAALYLAVRELETGASDLVITGGADTAQNPFMYMCFAKTQALSPSGRCRTFDQSADGIAISEGVAAVVLKRLVDAERDGDRIYAVIKGVGASSDGREKGLTAPRPAGQAKALRRAYAKAGFSPATVGLIEAHGTGTVAGDKAEVKTLRTVFEEEGADLQTCALGSVKSMIGHTKCTAGVAGLIKIALALHHKVLPPTLHVSEPNREAGFGESPFYVNTELRPWIQSSPVTPRRAGVSAFGFGGTNFHVAVEEYTDAIPTAVPPAVAADWPAELFLFRAETESALRSELEDCLAVVERAGEARLADIARAIWQRWRQRPAGRTLAIVASSLDDLQTKLGTAQSRVDGTAGTAAAAEIFFPDQPLAGRGSLAFLYPGQGSQYPGMMSELAAFFTELRESFEIADRVLDGRYARPLSRYVFPPIAFTPEERQRQMVELTATRIAQPALGAAEIGLTRLLTELGVVPDLVAGHSYGEYAALHAAGVFDAETLLSISELRGRVIEEEARQGLGTMAAVTADPGQVEEIIGDLADVWVANLNSPGQTVISGTEEAVEKAVTRFAEAGVSASRLPVACAFHSPLVASAADRLAAALREEIVFGEPQSAVYSNTSAAAYPETAAASAKLLVQHLTSPVRFADEIRAMHDDGARVFVEVGPKSVLSGLAEKILAGRPAAILTLDPPGRSGLRGLLGALGALAAHGYSVDLERLFAGRAAELVDPAQIGHERQLPPAAWLVNGGRARPVDAPQPTATPTTAARQKSASPAPAVAARESMPTVSPPLAAVTPAAVEPHDPGVSTAASSDLTGVVLEHQRLMARFLETQQSIMQAYLTGQPVESATGELPTREIRLDGVSMPAPDTVAPVARAAKPEAAAVAAAAPAPAEPPSMAPSLTPEKVTELLISVVSERTGYPEEMLKLDANITSDLGIDSIKWVEILGAFQRACPPQMGDGLRARMDDLVGAKTLTEVGAVVAATLVAVGSEPGFAPPAPAAAAAAPTHGPEELEALLIEVVSERTGYPPEMLKVDAHITSDLGIDSIKWVEILGALQGVVDTGLREHMRQITEQLTAAKSLRQVVELLGSGTETGAVAQPATVEPGAPAGAAGTVDLSAPADHFVPRFVIEARVVSPANAAAVPFRSTRPLLIFEDDGGVAEASARRLEDRGQPVIRVRNGAEVENSGDGVWVANRSDRSQIDRLIESIRSQHGPVGGVLFLALDGPSEAEIGLDLVAWKARLDREVRSLFHIAQAVATDLRAAASEGAACFVAATAMGGSFGIDLERAGPSFAGQAAIAGLIKTLALEWEQVRCKVVDLDRGDAVAEQVTALLAEIDSADDEVEVGVRSDQRRLLRPARPGAVPDGARMAPLDSETVVLITGGARGITAQIGLELAARYRPRLILIGRSPEPAATEAPETAGVESESDLKSLLFERLRQSQGDVAPVDLERAYRRLVAERQMRRNLADMRAFGSEVTYVEADVLDEDSLRRAWSGLQASHDRIDVLIHGAGIIEDKLLVDKTRESFDRVFDTKVDGLLNLHKILQSESPRLLVLFASVAGRFGNRGQCDYAAANEVMNRLAVQLRGRWAERVVSINWGPWQQTGMASSEVQRRFAERGVQLIGPRGGRDAFVEVLERGRSDEVEIILGDGPWRQAVAAIDADGELDLPLVTHRGVSNNGQTEWTCTLDPVRDLYLDDHRLDGRPVLPAAVALEYIVEAVQNRWPDWYIVAVRDFQVLHGVVLEDGPKDIQLSAHSVEIVSRSSDRIEVEVKLLDGESGRKCYGALVDLATSRTATPRPEVEAPSSLEAFPMSVETAYDRWLFHGPVFQTIEEIQGVTENVIVGLLKPSSPRSCISNTTSDHWLIDPVIVDGAFQLTLLFARLQTDMTPLPARFGALRLFRELNGSDVRCVIRARFSGGGQQLQTQTAFISPAGELIGVLEDAEFTSSPALNRLGGQWRKPRSV